MNIQQYLKLMHFPKEWVELDMLPPEELISENIRTYEPGIEQASEHDRNGFFQYWLRQNLSRDQISKLETLAHLDPDELMAREVIGSLLKLKEVASHDNKAPPNQ